MLTVNLSPAALQDMRKLLVDGIGDYGVSIAEQYQLELVDKFDLLAKFPQIGHPTDHPTLDLLYFNHRAHNIVYTVTDKILLINRILYYRMEIKRHL